MPHIIVEYAEQLLDAEGAGALLEAVRLGVAESGLYKAEQIKTRAYGFRAFTSADGRPYIHIQARIKSGREGDNARRMARAVLSRLDALDCAAAVVTVEVVEMDRASYGKWVPD
ncbi:MAG: hypothetical protein B0D96_06660 [Candidatus Sedimenticola endophacoides]|uniref:5-carboxymethyl-2-hydroxymuconate isomerase n=1 Tax=Candidatus Sedimenticola endophacoides TaxID=2548426 RepID=A0A657PQJ9_9GAMM|nr:MAG: hypothetical protein B0D94_09190 [Candidatus Sedimenticola endophacoides]OQX34911.1 MAG: hypothetical protein B0D84_02970 [Candidatus Sedimenticola endophacoides]OQX35521.1 MAG: hypothetical protein B0D96_06660 [Candidatus Sedimenticola endophacoides]OQX40300.1 MAG: hypothetical protein B0D88_08735 [Candidatus Sedimenticola endophacoides]OQX40677.1 MAG: hypothetical protein B0D89_06890 [Candidatus Sedimenticola endophacoides]